MRMDWHDEGRKKVISDWQDLKFGMFIHFGLFSVSAGCWNGKNISKGYAEMIMVHGDVPQADYEGLVDQFTIEHFDADEIASLAKAAGMKYIVLVSKHHDGFCLFDTKTTDYSSMHSACHRDVVAEMSKACARAGLRFGIYYSWIDWHYPYALPFSLHNSDRIPKLHMQYTLAQLSELLSNYGPLCELWLDMGAPTAQQSEAVACLARSLQPHMMINGRIWNDFGDFMSMADNALPFCHLDSPWEMPATFFPDAWCYRRFPKRENPAAKIEEKAEELFRVVGSGGNYLLNIGPRGDGSVTEFEREVLLGIGQKVKQKGLARKEKPVSISEEIDAGRKSFVLEKGEPHSRYTGAEYYSLHPIVTGYSWDLKLDEGGIFDLKCRLECILEHEQKLCIDAGSDTFIFTLKEGIKEMGIRSGLKLDAGICHVAIYTPGNPLSRPEFPDLCARLEFSRQAT
jgi:alpha-L-fucosidase